MNLYKSFFFHSGAKMRTRTKDKKNFLKVGAFISFLTLILMILIISIGKETSLFESKIIIKALAPNVSNLKVGSYVELKGIRIGTVKNIEIISQDLVEIRMKILEKELKWINKNSKIAISTAGLVGDKYIEIMSEGKKSKPFNPLTDILKTKESHNLQNMVTKGEVIASRAESILVKIDNILGDEENQQIFKNTINALHKSSINMEKISSDFKKVEIDQIMKSLSKSIDSFKFSSASLQKILQRVENGPGTLNSIIFDDGLHNDVRKILGGAQRSKTFKYFIRKSIEKSSE